MPLIKSARNLDGSYGPSSNGYYYISKQDHRRTAKYKKDKTRWCIEEGEEYSVFKPAVEDYNAWFSKENNCIFSIIDSATVTLGKSGEKLAKFPNDRNEGEPWHGYPVSTDESQNRPSSDQLELLKDKLPLHVIVKIEKGTL
ncbi:hypothetical protein SAMN05192574_106100 [Mucilaginibacter gossypiicola]|uniref:Uncharacterized protein n=1 Tax=Mucilaginibacter gossypiicola TaxID=551995 RepID=A0A1H8MVD9_9SPHI|nr:hypothetical protein [Mucilaginibacter gossypiicola]SEO21220.1 hypothetical protein SAMN05192574_106100 [Mucilaginibacter gossypiicola]